MGKGDKLRLVLALIFGIAGVILSFFGDTVGVSMMAAAGIALFLNYLLYRLISKDEMTKRISSVTSEFALFVAISTIGILKIMLHYYPTLLV